MNDRLRKLEDRLPPVPEQERTRELTLALMRDPEARDAVRAIVHRQAELGNLSFNELINDPTSRELVERLNRMLTRLGISSG